MLSFRNRLLILLIGLVAGAQIVTLFTALARTATEERRRADAQLVRGAEVVSQVLAARERQLATTVAVLVTDYGLRGAVTSGDALTVASALGNHGRRIGAELTLALDLEGNVIGRGPSQPADQAELVAALNRSEAGVQQGAAFFSTRSGTYQVFSAPMLAPDEVATIVLGFEVDQTLVEELRRLVDAEVAFLVGGVDGFHFAAGTVALAGTSGDAPLPSLRASPSEVTLQGRDYLATAIHLPGSGPPLEVALLKPMGEVMAPFRTLAWNLGLVFGITLVAAIVAGVVLGRSAARPVQSLAAGAARIAAGDYTRHVDSAGGRELAHLADAFNSMQSGIAEREARLTHLALHDETTGLPNRVHFIRWLDERLGEPGASRSFAIIQCTVTNLREISASLGFRMADGLVAHIARQLGGAMQGQGLVARLGGAGFAVAIEARAADALRQAGARVASLCAEPFTTDGIALRAAVVLGVALAPEDATSAEEALRCAQAAVESALSTGQPVGRFIKASDEAQRRRLTLGADLPRALQEGQLYLLYQPQRQLADGRISGVEELARWQHPLFGEISPSEFVPIAERTGASAQLAQWVLRTALGQLGRWHAQGLRIGLSVNLSAANLLDHNLLQDILGALRDTGLPPGSLTLEVTESVLLQDAQAVCGNIQLLRVAGVRLSIDDFGTGYSSLSQLRELAVDELKIDRSFVRGAMRGAEDEAMLRAIVQMARGMRLATVAEGVEHDAQHALLRELGCDLAQGFLVSRPATPEDLAPLLQASARSAKPGKPDSSPSMPAHAAQSAEAARSAASATGSVLSLRRRDS